jgi:hypothetical protein
VTAVAISNELTIRHLLLKVGFKAGLGIPDVRGVSVRRGLAV